MTGRLEKWQAVRGKDSQKPLESWKPGGDCWGRGQPLL